MAEASRIRDNHRENNVNNEERICILNLFCVFISLITILADLTTDLTVFAEYCKDGYLYWSLATLTYIIVPNILTNIFSIRWIIIDKKSTIRHYITHSMFVGFLERHFMFLYEVFKCKNLESVKNQKLVVQRNDLHLLHFLYAFTGTVPQIILQSYAILALDGDYHTKAFSLTASVGSAAWACATYVYAITSLDEERPAWRALSMKLTWHFGMLTARVAALLLFSVVFGLWTLVPLGLHWIAMTFWIVTQKTTFCPNKLEETFYNVVMGFVYCFCYINLRDGHTRYRLLLFYSFVVTQNFGSLLLYVLIADIEKQKRVWSVAATVCVVLGTVIGICGMVLYYRWFHEKGPITWKAESEDIELNNKVAQDKKGLTHVRSFKSQKNAVGENCASPDAPPPESQHADLDRGDKRLLLEHLLTSPRLPAAPASPRPPAAPAPAPDAKKTKRRAPPPDELTASALRLHKRRGICSSDELRGLDKVKDLADVAACDKVTSSDSIDLDLDLSFSDINSSDINTFNENIVQKLCLSALKNIKVGNRDADIENIQRIALDILKEMYSKKGERSGAGSRAGSGSADGSGDGSAPCAGREPPEALSVHDYENICAVNIAREAWGLRSWSGYCDIESWLHDGSVARRPPSSGASSCDHEPRVYCNVRDYADADDTFLAKPCLVDGPNLAPILEELDDGDDARRGSSALVATIDGIRAATAAGSPRRARPRPPLCHSPQLDTRLERALWKEPSKFNSNNIMESFPEKGAAAGGRHRAAPPPPARPHKATNLAQTKAINTNRPDDLHDLSNRDIDFLWKLVAETSGGRGSAEDLARGHLASSLQSLIVKEPPPASQKINTKKTPRNKPRRKFSILRERFEPKASEKSDEEILCQPRSPAEGGVVNRLADQPAAADPRRPRPRDRVAAQVDVDSVISRNVKDKRTLFMKQVLSPPKFNTKLKYKA